MVAEHESRTPGAVGYIRVSTQEQATSAFGYNDQRDAILAECRSRGLPLRSFYFDRGPYGLAGRLLTQDRYGLAQSGLSQALDLLADGRGSALMVANLDLLAGPAHDVSGVLRLARRQGWSVIIPDMSQDTTPRHTETPAPRANVLTEEQRRFIGQRTAEALAIRKAQGVRLGRPPQMPMNVVAAILRAYEQGHGWSAIARALNDAQVPTAQGGRRWYPSTVRAAVYSHS